MMISVFYQRKPERDTPYRELFFECDSEAKWHVVLKAGTKWGRDHAEKLSDFTAQDWQAAQAEYDRLFIELQKSGWRLYTPYESWD